MNTRLGAYEIPSWAIAVTLYARESRREEGYMRVFLDELAPAAALVLAVIAGAALLWTLA